MATLYPKWVEGQPTLSHRVVRVLRVRGERVAEIHCYMTEDVPKRWRIGHLNPRYQRYPALRMLRVGPPGGSGMAPLTFETEQAVYEAFLAAWKKDGAR